MKLIYNKYLPPGNFHGINLFGIVFVQRRWGRFNDYQVNHEGIHTLQQVEMLFVFFYVWYLVEYVVRLFLCRFDTDWAYRSISFEQEAYANEHNLDYRRHRRFYAWAHYLTSAAKQQKRPTKRPKHPQRRKEMGE